MLLLFLNALIVSAFLRDFYLLFSSFFLYFYNALIMFSSIAAVKYFQFLVRVF